MKGALPKFSRAQIQKAVKEGAILVNGKPAKSSHILKEKDEISSELKEPEKMTLVPQDLGVDVIFENKDYVVINKPAGMAVHPGIRTAGGTVANWLLFKYPDIKKAGEDPLRPGIVHRLDKDTSGLMVAAKNKKTFNYFKKLFKKRSVQKKYITLVSGKVRENKGKIELAIGRSKRNPTRQKAVLAQSTVLKEKPALTYFRVLKRFNDFTLLDVSPKTGRMHQIRVHFAALHSPVAGDGKYGFRAASKTEQPPRQFLHAYYLKFKDPAGRNREFKIGLAPDLKKFLQKLR